LKSKSIYNSCYHCTQQFQSNFITKVDIASKCWVMKGSLAELDQHIGLRATTRMTWHHNFTQTLRHWDHVSSNLHVVQPQLFHLMWDFNSLDISQHREHILSILKFTGEREQLTSPPFTMCFYFILFFNERPRLHMRKCLLERIHSPQHIYRLKCETLRIHDPTPTLTHLTYLKIKRILLSVIFRSWVL
jgi:hypothetical protein